jgi:plastocyanin
MSLRARAISLAAVAVLTASLFALPRVSAATFSVKARLTDAGYRWRPARLLVPFGSKVVWRMVDGSHTFRATSKNWSKHTGTLAPGSTTSFTFKRKGVYRYRCTIHSVLVDGRCSGMCGRVVVGWRCRGTQRIGRYRCTSYGVTWAL